MGSELWTRAPHLAVIAEHVGFSLAKFEVGQEGKTAYGRLMARQRRGGGTIFAEEILWKRSRARGPLGGRMGMCVYLDVTAITGGFPWETSVAFGSLKP